MSQECSAEDLVCRGSQKIGPFSECAGSKVFPGARNSGTVLVVDDMDVVREVLRTMLELREYRVLQAATGIECLALIHAHPEISLVILDLLLPEMDGDEIYSEILKIKPDLPVLLTSGFREHDVMRRFLDRRPIGFLQKPFDFAEVISRIEAALGTVLDSSRSLPEGDFLPV